MDQINQVCSLEDRVVHEVFGVRQEVDTPGLAVKDDGLIEEVNAALGSQVLTDVTAIYRGAYEWKVDLRLPEGAVENDETPPQIKFGPSAWFAKEEDSSWETRVPAEEADYSRLF
ncbi:MAG: hypothetical protein QM621_02970 [Aeromicrobium sp.]|uniref:hypothetical protein n=1 Tax=Aeromicrobium sp. TaxID=1871063 RepID=UPI0039E49E86